MKIAQRVAVVTCLATLLLIAIGAMVRATGSGLGCPDWPLCHGGAVPPGDKHSIIEFSHRFTASVVGFLVIATAVFAWKFYRHAPALVWVAVANVPLVGIQGILGAITVKRELPPEIVATHLLTAMAVLTCQVFVAIGMYRESSPGNQAAARAAKGAGRQLGLLSVAALALLAGVMWIGAYMAESGASTACSGWPACNGGILPGSDHQEVIHMLHRYMAGSLVFLVIPFVVMAWRQRHDLPPGRLLAIGGAVLYGLQVAVGALNVWYTFPDALTVSHTAIAAGVWTVLCSAAVVTLYAPAAQAVPANNPSRVPA